MPVRLGTAISYIDLDNERLDLPLTVSQEAERAHRHHSVHLDGNETGRDSWKNEHEPESRTLHIPCLPYSFASRKGSGQTWQTHIE